MNGMKNLLSLSILMLLAACGRNHFLSGHKQLSFGPDVLLEEEPQKIKIHDWYSSSKKLKNSLLVIKYSGRDEVTLNEFSESIEFKIKSTRKNHEFEMIPQFLPGASHYGIYYCQSKKCSIKFKFYVKSAPPKLVSHDWPEGEWPIIAQNRIFFSFRFAQPIYVPHSESLKIYSKEGNEIYIEKFFVQKNEIHVQIKANQLSYGGNYYFLLDQIYTVDKRKSTIEKKFKVGLSALPFVSLSQPNFLLMQNGAEFSWFLNNDHRLEIFIKKNGRAIDCSDENCSIERNTVASKIDGKRGYLSTVFISGLKPKSEYSVSILVRDLQNHKLEYEKDFETTSKSYITLSEILVNPHSDQRSNQYEFLEYVNFSSHDEIISDMHLIVEDSLSKKYRDCLLIPKNNTLIWPAHSYLLVVGHDFDEQKIAVPHSTKIIRLKQKSLCGGLSNSRAKNIKLVLKNKVILDRYGAHLWPGDKGSSIQKLDVNACDEVSNYRYSAKGHGPSPGY